MRWAARDAVAAAIDCARCRRLVAFAPERVMIDGEWQADLETPVAYRAAAHFDGHTKDGAAACPDCGRVVVVSQLQNVYAAVVKLDRPVKPT